MKKGAAAFVLSAAIALPAAAHHNDNGDINPVRSQTEHSQELRSIQDKFNRAVRDRRIILIDRDWIQINRAINDIRAGDEELRNRYLIEYLVREGRLHLPTDFFKDLDDSQIFNNPHARMFTLTVSDGRQLQACTVYGGRGEMDGATAVREFIAPSNAIHGREIADADVLLTLDADEYKKFVTYHEIGHCMDDWFVRHMNAAPTLDERFALYHRAETFADVFSALMMAREEGVTGIAETIANIRLANAALSGPFQVQWTGPIGNTHYATYVYATHRPVRAAQDYIDRHGPQALQAMSYQQVAELARDLVNQHALNDLEADALMYLFAAKHDLRVWEQTAQNVPYIARRLPYARQLQQEMEQALRTVLDLGHVPANQSVLSRITFAGTPAQLRQERLSQIDQAALQARGRALAQDMIAAAGGASATLPDLIRVFTERKDRWRETLSTGTDAQREDARENLQVAGYALHLAANEIRARQPTNDNEPAAPGPAVSSNFATPNTGPA